jgi:hypothetical protein
MPMDLIVEARFKMPTFTLDLMCNVIHRSYVNGIILLVPSELTLRIGCVHRKDHRDLVKYGLAITA